MDLTIHQQQSLAALKDNEGFALLLDGLQAMIDYFLDALADAKRQEDALFLLQEWKALRRIVFFLKTTPETVAEDLVNSTKGIDEFTLPVSAWKQIRDQFGGDGYVRK